MAKIDPAYVFAPFHQLLGNSQNNVLMGLRLVEKLKSFPDPTPEELQFLQLSIGGVSKDIEQNKSVFKKWILLNGFQDIHNCFRTTLERLYILRTISREIQEVESHNIEEKESELKIRATIFNYPTLISNVNALFEEPLKFQIQMESMNNARNCLVHTNGVVTERHCNDSDKNRLIIYGNRFKFYFKKGDEEVIAELGKPGPENAALMLSSEEFQVEFSLGSMIELSLRQFLDVLNTCVFVRADIDEKLK